MARATYPCWTLVLWSGLGNHKFFGYSSTCENHGMALCLTSCPSMSKHKETIR